MGKRCVNRVTAEGARLSDGFRVHFRPGRLHLGFDGTLQKGRTPRVSLLEEISCYSVCIAFAVPTAKIDHEVWEFNPLECDCANSRRQLVDK